MNRVSFLSIIVIALSLSLIFPVWNVESSPKATLLEKMKYYGEWWIFNVGTFALSVMDKIRVLVTPPEFLLWEMSSGFVKSQAIYAAAKLNIANSLIKESKNSKGYESTPKTLLEIAEECGVYNFEFFERLMRHLEAVYIVETIDGQRYQMSKIGELLWDQHPKSSRALIISQNTDHYLSTSELYNSIVNTDKKSPFQLYYSDYDKVWEFYKDHPQHSYWFNRYMHSVNSQLVQIILEDYHYPEIYEYNSIIDVGGGQGLLISSILDSFLKYNEESVKKPKLAIFDLPEVVEQDLIVEFWNDKATTVELIGGNFFESIPSGFDCYLLKFILHDWTDEECITILSNIRKAIGNSSKARILIIENVLLETSTNIIHQSHTTIDMIMVSMTNGKERTISQYEKLLESSNFKLNRVIYTRSPATVIEAIIE